MLTQIHFLLTYTCNYECDHCFLYSGPKAEGTFTIAQIQKVLGEAKKLDTVDWIYFEGGEPFLYFPIMVEGLRIAKAMGFKTGVVTNSYWATTKEDAVLWLKPVLANGIENLGLSDDSFHHGDIKESPAQIAAKAAASLGLSTNSICIEKPTVQPSTDFKGEPVVGGGALFKGRAVEKLTGELPTKPPECFLECRHEELVVPKRVHIDAFGNVQVCQGISIGNMWQKSLSVIINEYDAVTHPICGPLSRGGPIQLAKAHNLALNGEFVDECHYCFMIRHELINLFPEYLSPYQVYGLSKP